VATHSGPWQQSSRVKGWTMESPLSVGALEVTREDVDFLGGDAKWHPPMPYSGPQEDWGAVPPAWEVQPGKCFGGVHEGSKSARR
jgi:hypothetical protein